RLRLAAAASCAALLAIGAVNQSAKIVEIQWIKGGKHQAGMYEKWNALSRIFVGENGSVPFGWGMSPTFRPKQGIEQLYLNIDSGAATVITKFDGNFEALDHLK